MRELIEELKKEVIQVLLLNDVSNLVIANVERRFKKFMDFDNKDKMEDSKYSNAERAINRLLDEIYCKKCNENCEETDLEIPATKQFIYAVLDAIGITYKFDE